MNSQNNEDDSMNFSVIDRNAEAEAAADFSVRSLLGEEEPLISNNPPETLSMQKSVEDVFSKIRKMQVPGVRSIIKGDSKPSEQGTSHNFLRDLSRMEKELSFESELFNIYEENNVSASDVLQMNKSKTQSCLKLTKESTNKSTNKSTSKEDVVILSDYFGPLIIDFRKQSKAEQHGHSKQSSSAKNSKNHLARSKNESNSQLSSEYSSGNKCKETKMKKSQSKDHLQELFGGRGKSKSCKNLLEVADFKKSKSRSNNNKVRGISKSHSNLKINAQNENYYSKVFTQYYGTEVNITKKKPELKVKKEVLTKVKSREKSSHSKHKFQLLSPRGKVSTRPIAKK